METSSTPEFVIGQTRLVNLAEMTYFYVANQPTPIGNLDRDLDAMMPELEAAKAEAGIPEAGPVVLRYYPVEAPGNAEGPALFRMEVGVPVRAGVQPAGAAQVKTLPPFPCAALLYWGSLAHVREAYDALFQAIRAGGLEHIGEGREWYYHFEGDASPNNVLGLCLAVREIQQ
jgi:effector-binding domain-containing protein